MSLVPSPLRRSLKSSESQDGEKKKSKGGFLNLIKRSSKSDKTDKSDKSDKSEKNQATSSAPSAASVASTPASTIPEEPSSPKVSVKSPAPEAKSRYRLSKMSSVNYPLTRLVQMYRSTPDSLILPVFTAETPPAARSPQTTAAAQTAQRSWGRQTP